jgi:hypothetical protein
MHKIRAVYKRKPLCFLKVKHSCEIRKLLIFNRFKHCTDFMQISQSLENRGFHANAGQLSTKLSTEKLDVFLFHEKSITCVIF